MAPDLESPMPTGLTSRIPQEIFDHIIARSTTSLCTLKELSLVGHAWLRTSRLHLFSSITLSPALLDFLHSSPDARLAILRYVRHLRIVGDNCIKTAGDGGQSPLWDIILAMTVLQALTLDRCGTGTTSILGAFFALTTMSARVTSLNIRRGRFSSFESIQTFVSSFRALQHLKLMDLGCESHFDPDWLGGEGLVVEPQVTSSCLATLQHLEVIYCHGNRQILDWISASTTTLKTLVASDLTATDLGILKKFNDLEHLTLGLCAEAIGELQRPMWCIIRQLTQNIYSTFQRPLAFMLPSFKKPDDHGHCSIRIPCISVRRQQCSKFRHYSE